jgi:hypothetical protein
MLEDAEIVNDTGADKYFKNYQQLALLNQVGLAGLENDFRDIQHGFVGRKFLDVEIFVKTEPHPGEANQKSDHQEMVLGRA